MNSMSKSAKWATIDDDPSVRRLRQAWFVAGMDGLGANDVEGVVQLLGEHIGQSITGKRIALLAPRGRGGPLWVSNGSPRSFRSSPLMSRLQTFWDPRSEGSL